MSSRLPTLNVSTFRSVMGPWMHGPCHDTIVPGANFGRATAAWALQYMASCWLAEAIRGSTRATCIK